MCIQASSARTNPFQGFEFASISCHPLAYIPRRPMFADVLLGRPSRAPPGILGFVKKVRLDGQVPLHKHRHRAGHAVWEDRRE
jgi:hypothetical protein